MKKCTSILTFFSFILISCHALATTTYLSTYYPPPVGAYNKVQLSSNYTAASTTVCNGLNNGVIYANTSGILMTCVLGAPQTYCNASNNGALIADNNGTLHVCTNNGTSSIYPQECYNAFCSYDSTTDPGGVNTCITPGSPFPVNLDSIQWALLTAFKLLQKPPFFPSPAAVNKKS